jgi:hypothetical protein
MKKSTIILIAIIALMITAIAVAGVWETSSAQAYAGAYLDDSTATGTINLAASSTQYTLPGRPGLSKYVICARGNRAFIRCGDNPTATTSAGGYVFSVPDSACLGPLRLKGPKCAHIASSATGQVEFLHINPEL